jgi:hypothetical protein
VGEAYLESSHIEWNCSNGHSKSFCRIYDHDRHFRTIPNNRDARMARVVAARSLLWPLMLVQRIITGIIPLSTAERESLEKSEQERIEAEDHERDREFQQLRKELERLQYEANNGPGAIEKEIAKRVDKLALHRLKSKDDTISTLSLQNHRLREEIRELKGIEVGPINEHRRALPAYKKEPFEALENKWRRRPY